ncbi:hypothetical protein SDC9_139206 [bioreactor metagenome]|uniref:Uncharacterized protein n=1 Tax=bioreactor metagenome TaxID=1076179 RepID=A0A645DUP5_9ZZZZ
MIAHQYAFHKVFVLKAEEVFDGAVFFGDQFSFNFDSAVGDFGELITQRSGQICHLLRTRAFVEPLGNLLGAKLRFAKVREQRFKFGSIEIG